MHKSGPIRVVIHVDLDDGLDMSSVVAMVASIERPGKGQLCDADWFHEDLSQCGLDELLGLSDWDDLKSGLWVVEGYLWGECLQTVNGDEYDGGFEVEKAEPLTDVQAFLADWLEDHHDLGLCERLRKELMSVDPGVRETARQRLDVLQEVLCVLREIVELSDASSDV
jgi:hypothetical protein